MLTAVLFTTDLACSSHVTGTAALHGMTVEVAMSAGALLDKAPGCRLVLLDLNSPGSDPAVLVPQLKALNPPPAAIIAFGPHVHEANLAAAGDAGCDEVLTRGQFHAQWPELCRRYA